MLNFQIYDGQVYGNERKDKSRFDNLQYLKSLEIQKKNPIIL